MKCENCIFKNTREASVESPHPSEWCGRGYWNSLNQENITDDEVMETAKKCKDFSSTSAPQKTQARSFSK